jgi:hypothetical protein
MAALRHRRERRLGERGPGTPSGIMPRGSRQLRYSPAAWQPQRRPLNAREEQER